MPDPITLMSLPDLLATKQLDLENEQTKIRIVRDITTDLIQGLRWNLQYGLVSQSDLNAVIARILTHSQTHKILPAQLIKRIYQAVALQLFGVAYTGPRPQIEQAPIPPTKAAQFIPPRVTFVSQGVIPDGRVALPEPEPRQKATRTAT